ncbi:sulfotransferase domain-containing protein [Candidatus Nomurabacteria bacterium]|nr:sulfotransferase domain-containing protein [Candidatus Nomurabacteria bacterium]
MRKRARKKSILLVRDPRDVVVSYYFQITQREPDVKKLYFQDKDVTMSEFIRHDKLGIANIVSYMNVLYEVVQEVRGNDFLIISYRDLKNKPFVTLKKLFEYAGITNVDNTLLQ